MQTTSRPANPVHFIELIDAMNNMDPSVYDPAAEAHGGQLGIVSDYWNQCRALPDTLNYDPCDAGYIMSHLRDLHQLHYCHPVDASQLPRLWALALDAAVAISAVVDFDDADLGVFCYEQLGAEPGDLVYKLYYEVVQAHGNAHDVVLAHAQLKGWPLNAPA